jgi:hypothetical protein
MSPSVLLGVLHTIFNYVFGAQQMRVYQSMQRLISNMFVAIK